MKALTALLAGTALTVLPATADSILIGPDGLPITIRFPIVNSVENVGELSNGIPRATIIKGMDMSPEWQCLGEMVSYIAFVLNLSEGETYTDALNDLDGLGVSKESLRRLERNILEDDFPGSSSYLNQTFLNGENFYEQGLLSESGTAVATFYDKCPEQPLPPPQYLEGKVTKVKQYLSNPPETWFTLKVSTIPKASYDVFISSGFRINNGETVRLYDSSCGFTPSHRVGWYEKMEIVSDEGEVLFTYGPQYYPHEKWCDR